MRYHFRIVIGHNESDIQRKFWKSIGQWGDVMKSQAQSADLPEPLISSSHFTIFIPFDGESSSLGLAIGTEVDRMIAAGFLVDSIEVESYES